MEKSNKKALEYFPEMATQCALITIKPPVVDSHNQFAPNRSQTVPDVSEVQIPKKHDFSETFERDKVDGKTVGKGEFNIFVTRLCKLQSEIFFEFIIYFNLFYTDGKAANQSHMEGSPTQ